MPRGRYDDRVAPFVVLSLVLAVFALGFIVVVTRHLKRTIGKLTAQVRATTERLAPLTEELQAELAVTSTEIDGLTAGVERLQKERAARPKRRRSKRKH